MKKQHNLEKQDPRERYSQGGSYGKSNYNAPLTSTQIAWRVGLFILGAIVGAVIANL